MKEREYASEAEKSQGQRGMKLKKRLQLRNGKTPKGIEGEARPTLSLASQIH